MSKRTVELELATPGLDVQGRPARIPLTVAGGAERQQEPSLDGEHMLMNIGPQHPATHGVLRLVVELDGETRSEEHTSELQSPCNLVCRLLLEKKKTNTR